MNKLDTLLKNATKITIDNDTKLVIMSDCHRGIGNNSDNFLKNRNIFKAALNTYYKKGFTYIELGDGDDMWEVKNYDEIIKEYLDVFKLLKKFYLSNRLIMIFGNHDKCKESNEILKKYFYIYHNKITNQEENLLNGLTVQESLILNYKKKDILLIHGHQGDFLNDNLWKFSRFLVRYIWKNLEFIGIKDPTSAAKNNRVTKKTEKRLKKWSNKHNKIIIAGHTHRAIYPKAGESMYFNDGSCVHPDGITCIEIEKGYITLVRWLLKVREDNTIFVEKEIIEGPLPLINFFK